MTKRTTIISVVLIAVLVATLLFGVATSLDLTSADTAYADTPVSSEADFILAISSGTHDIILNNDITVNTNVLSLNGHVTIDLNGYTLKSGLRGIETKGYDVTFKSSKPGKGCYDGNLRLTRGKDYTTLTILDGVFISEVRTDGESKINIYDDSSFENSHMFLFDKIYLTNGIIKWFSFYGSQTNFDNTDQRFLDAFTNGIIVGNTDGRSLYIKGQKDTAITNLWNYEGVLRAFPSDGYRDIYINNGGLACIANPQALNGGLEATINGNNVRVESYYATGTRYNDYPGSLSFEWYRSVNGLGYQKCESGFATGNGYIEDRTYDVVAGANAYTYYAIITGSNGMKSVSITTAKATVYSAPLDPINVNITGQENAVTGSDVTLTGVYKQNPNNVSGNVIKNEYRWQKYNAGTEEWVDISGATKVAYKPSTSTAGTTKYRFGVRTMGKGNQASEWVFSDAFDFVVGVYNSPVAKLSSPTEIEEVKGYDVQVDATVDNANYFDGVTYQWYYVWAYAEGTPLYKAIENGTKNGYTFANVDTAALTISRETTNADPLIVRCQVTGTKNGYKRNANTEDVSVSFIDLPKPVITTQPQGANLAKSNGSHAIAVYASTKQGTLTYQWQSSEDGNTWANIEGANAFNYLVDRSVATNGTYYRCVVSNAAGSVNSDAAKFVIKDGTVLNAELVKGLEVRYGGEALDGYVIDNDERTLVCHLGDVFLIGFDASEGNATDFDKSIGTDWRNETGLGDNGMGERYIDTSMSGTFEYYGRFYAEYDDGLGHIQFIEYNRENDERMRFTVVVLPREDTAEIAPVTVELGDSETIAVGSANYPLIFTNGDISTNAQTWFRGNHKASSYYHFVTGYRLYVGIPNEDEEIEYICFAQTDYYGDGTEPYNNAQDLIFDTSAAKLVALGLETLDGVYDAYVVMDYQSIINENVDDQFVVKRGAFEGHHFALTVVAPCQHEHVTATYTFGTDETYGAYIMIANKCDICEENLAGA